MNTLFYPQINYSQRTLCYAVSVVSLSLACGMAHAAPYKLETLGLTDARHTHEDGHQSSYASGYLNLNEAGQVMGTSTRYKGANSHGRSAWFYNGNSTQQIGLTDADHNRNALDDGYQYNETRQLNEAGQVIGTTTRYKGAKKNGESA